jgi:hypothetical protein
LSRLVTAEIPAPEPKKLLLTPALRVVPSNTAPEPARPTPAIYRSVAAEAPESAEDDSLFGALDLKPHKPKQVMTEVVSTIATAVVDADSQWESETGDVTFEGLDWESPLWEDDPAPLMAEPAPKTVVGDARTPSPELPQVEEAQDPFVDGDAFDAASYDLQDGLPEATSPPDDPAAPAAEWVDAEVPDPALAETLASSPFSRRFVQEVSDRAEAEAVAEIMRATQAEASARTNPQGDHPSDFRRNDDADPEAETDPADNQGGYFDEAVLRDLVRDLIREELSGTLGERITRNVRKLVRAEINRSLTARDFE